ncbi:MAG TPA: hypothetical protein VFC19_13555 [Candidatus Limnocylindrales bacterium]|nr:hypothetical protein [Candidatus Limnocylindrales bacterium]
MGYDPIGLRPATVEELAAQDRKKAPPPRHRRSSRRPLVIILATFALLVGGAGAFALARTSDAPTALVQPYGPDAPFGVDYVDGFGEHSPKPTPRPSSRKPRPAQAAAATVATKAGPSPLDSPYNILLASQLSAVYWSRAFDGRYDTYIWIHNEGPTSATWEVRVKLPDGARLTDSSAVNRTSVDGTWVFTSTKGSLGAGLVYLFSFSGTTGSSRFSLRSCTVNGAPCEPFR